MTELEIMQHAKMYIDKLANGIDPLTGQPVNETDIVNNVRISRCLFYVSDVLRQVIDNGGDVGKKQKTAKPPFSLPPEALGRFRYSPAPIPISEITKRFNELTPSEETTQLRHTALTNWLLKTGMLENKEAADGKTIKRPTAQGKALGISTEKRNGQYGEYVVVLYNRDAQQFLVDNLDAVLENEKKAREEKERLRAAEKERQSAAPVPDPQGPPWTPDQENDMIDLYAQRRDIPEIAAVLNRTEADVRFHLTQMGFLKR